MQEDLRREAAPAVRGASQARLDAPAAEALGPESQAQTVYLHLNDASRPTATGCSDSDAGDGRIGAPGATEAMELLAPAADVTVAATSAQDAASSSTAAAARTSAVMTINGASDKKLDEVAGAARPDETCRQACDTGTPQLGPSNSQALGLHAQGLIAYSGVVIAPGPIAMGCANSSGGGGGSSRTGTPEPNVAEPPGFSMQPRATSAHPLGFVGDLSLARTKPRGRNTSIYIGVHKTNKKQKPWTAACYWDGKQHHLGYFSTEEEAALAYDECVRSRGLVRHLNLPQHRAATRCSTTESVAPAPVNGEGAHGSQLPASCAVAPAARGMEGSASTAGCAHPAGGGGPLQHFGCQAAGQLGCAEPRWMLDPRCAGQWVPPPAAAGLHACYPQHCQPSLLACPLAPPSYAVQVQPYQSEQGAPLMQQPPQPPPHAWQQPQQHAWQPPPPQMQVSPHMQPHMQPQQPQMQPQVQPQQLPMHPQVLTWQQPHPIWAPAAPANCNAAVGCGWHAPPQYQQMLVAQPMVGFMPMPNHTGQQGAQQQQPPQPPSQHEGSTALLYLSQQQPPQSEGAP